MMNDTTQILVAYASKHGSTTEVADALATQLRAHGYDVDLRPAAEVRTLDGYTAVVLGGAIYTGRWHRAATGFLKRHRGRLATTPLAVFAMGPRTLAPADVVASRIQLDKALAAVPDLEPYAVAIFGGVIDPTGLRFPFSRMPASDARDWTAIAAFGDEVRAGLGAVTAVPV